MLEFQFLICSISGVLFLFITFFSIYESVLKPLIKLMSLRRANRIFIVRHGQSEGNVDHSTYQRTPDYKISLTEKGKKQALEAGKKIKKIIKNESVFWYVSPYKRSMQTFEEMSKAFSGKNQQKWREDPRLREQEWGNFQSYDWERISQERREFGSFYYRLPGGESGAHVYGRISIFLGSLFRRMEKKRFQNIIIVSHGYTSKVILAKWFNWNISILQNVWHFKNCQFVTLEKSFYGKYKIRGEFEINEPFELPQKDFINNNIPS